MVKKILCTLMMLAVLCSQSHAGVVYSGVVLGGAEAVTSDPTPTDITFFWTCESQTLGASDYSAGDTTASDDQLTTDAEKYGSYGVDCPDDWRRMDFTNDSDILIESEGTYAAWFYFNAFTQNGASIFSCEGAANDYKVIVQTTGALIQDFNSNYNNTGYTLSTGQWYFIQFSWDAVADDFECKVDDDATPYTDSDDLGSLTLTTLSVGNNTTNDCDFYIDNVMISNDFDRDFYVDTFNGTAYKDLTESPR